MSVRRNSKAEAEKVPECSTEGQIMKSIHKSKQFRIVGMQVVNIAGMKLRNKECKCLFKTLQQCLSLTELNLQANRIGGKGCKWLSESLMQSRSLAILNLKKNKISTRGCKWLANALKKNAYLTTLDLSSNNISSAGCKWLGNALKLNHTLTTLNLRFNRIDDKGSRWLCKAMKHNQSLTQLLIGGNRITYNGQPEFITKCLSYNRRKASILDTIIILFNIARRAKESFALFPVEIWLIIFEYYCSTISNIAATALKIFDTIDTINQCIKCNTKLLIVFNKTNFDLCI